MKFFSLFIPLIAALSTATAEELVTAATAAATSTGPEPTTYQLTICSNSNPLILGTYTSTTSTAVIIGGTHTFKNTNSLSPYGFWRHDGFWYFGEIASWPPVTIYRCYMDCPHGSPVPPVTGYVLKRGETGGELDITQGECGDVEL